MQTSGLSFGLVAVIITLWFCQIVVAQWGTPFRVCTDDSVCCCGQMCKPHQGYENVRQHGAGGEGKVSDFCQCSDKAPFNKSTWSCQLQGPCATNGAECEMDVECCSGQVCNSGTCACPEGLVWEDDACVSEIAASAVSLNGIGFETAVKLLVSSALGFALF